MQFFQSKPKCPTCNSQLKEKPKRKQKCPHCGNEILVRSGRLVSAEEAFIIDWLASLEFFGVTRDNFIQTRDRLTKKFGKTASANDTIWSILNRLIIKHGADNNALQQIYEKMSSLVASEGKDPTPYLLEAAKARKARNEEFQKTLSSPDELESKLHQILYGDNTNSPTDKKNAHSLDSHRVTNSKNESTNNNQETQKVFLGQDELAFVRKIRSENKLDQAEELLRRAEPSPAVLDELRKIASTIARTAKKENDWQAVIYRLDSYTTYANQWREYCIKLVNQEPPDHTESDKKLLQEAKRKILAE